MSIRDDGGSAFPNDGKWANGVQEGGMSLRDWFAGMALQGMCASRDEAGVLVNHGYDWLASESYAIADAMLAARGK